MTVSDTTEISRSALAAVSHLFALRTTGANAHRLKAFGARAKSSCAGPVNQSPSAGGISSSVSAAIR